MLSNDTGYFKTLDSCFDFKSCHSVIRAQWRKLKFGKLLNKFNLLPEMEFGINTK